MTSSASLSKISHSGALWPDGSSYYKSDAVLWISYPKKGSKMETDMSLDLGWDTITQTEVRSVSQVSVYNRHWNSDKHKSGSNWTHFRSYLSSFGPFHLFHPIENFSCPFSMHSLTVGSTIGFQKRAAPALIRIEIGTRFA